jgi:hypothetical protein
VPREIFIVKTFILNDAPLLPRQEEPTENIVAHHDTGCGFLVAVWVTVGYTFVWASFLFVHLSSPPPLPLPPFTNATREIHLLIRAACCSSET